MLSVTNCRSGVQFLCFEAVSVKPDAMHLVGHCRIISYPSLGHLEQLSDIMHLMDVADMHVAANTSVRLKHIQTDQEAWMHAYFSSCLLEQMVYLL